MAESAAARRKIVMVEIAGKGGICHYTFNLCQHLQLRAEVHLLTGRRYELETLAPAFRVEEMFDRFRTNPAFLPRFLRLIAQPEVLAVHFQLSQFPALILPLCAACRALKRLTVVTAHNVLSHEEKAWERLVFRQIYRLSDRIVVHARQNREEMARLFPFSAGKIRVIPHGNYVFFNPAGPAPEPREETRNLLFFGYIRPYKGLMQLIRAVKTVKEHFPALRLIIAGRPVEDFAPYRDEIRRLGLEDNVTADLDYISFEQVSRYFTQADVVVLPYLKVYQSGVLQLAYAFSRPVIVTDAGGMAEAVEEGRSGFVVPAGDEAALAQKLLHFFRHPDLRRSMGEYAAGLARTKFSWERIAAQTLEMYERN